MQMGYRYRELVIYRPQDDPDFAPACPWPRKTPIDYRTDRTWYPVICQPNRERHAFNWAFRGALCPYWPHFTEHKHGKDGKQRQRVKSVIPGLIFIPMATGRETFGYVRSLPGVWDFMMLGGEPQALMEWQLNVLREKEGELNIVPEDLTIPDWCVKGVIVTIKIVGDENWDLSGPIVDIASGGRIGVEVQLLGSRRTIYSPVSKIAPI
jgi:transcription antitermination factor NusG